MADHGPTPPPAQQPVRRPDAVIDLRTEPPVRHRQSRGVPREPDARMRAYRDRPVHPPIIGAPPRNRPIEVKTLFRGTTTDHVNPPTEVGTQGDDLGLDGPVDVQLKGALRDRVGRVDVEPAPEPAVEQATPRDEPAVSTYRGSDGTQRVLMGRLIVKRLRLRSVAKVALTFYLCLWAVVAVAGTILWSLANREGWVTGWTGFLVDLGFTDAAVDGTTLARASATAGAIVVVTITLLTIAAAFFYNQLSGLIGGVEVTLASTKHRGGRRGRRRLDRERRRERDRNSRRHRHTHD